METVTRSKHDALLFVSSVHMVYKCNVTFIAEYVLSLSVWTLAFLRFG